MNIDDKFVLELIYATIFRNLQFFDFARYPIYLLYLIKTEEETLCFKVKPPLNAESHGPYMFQG